ncbi:hypothetical protein [Kitasatospora mediocidica]|uniref:hypothetical protein n=1 Tax=Kitasatospora mediocidica TaxID=58352 RepID=UPI0012F7B957|nr:hypothetical protein [Kitasatospora mediocidica]
MSEMKKRNSADAKLSWPWQAWDELMQNVRIAYEDLRNPRRAFALTAARQQPYRDLIGALGAMASVTDDTDINCDVCFTYMLELDGLFFVRLSMVGPYVTFARSHDERAVKFIHSHATCSSDFERDVLRLLMTRGFRVLSDVQLAAAIDLTFPGIEHAKVYNALFSPEEEWS